MQSSKESAHAPIDLRDVSADCASGRLLLEAMDLMKPGCVDWSQVDRDKSRTLKQPKRMTKQRTGISQDDVDAARK